MVERRIILELGMGNDLHGGDYTKAALRAVDDALRHSSLTLLRSLSIDPASMRVQNHDWGSASGGGGCGARSRGVAPRESGGNRGQGRP